MSRLLTLAALALLGSASADSIDTARAKFASLMERSDLKLTAEERAAFEARFVSSVLAEGDDFFDDEFVMEAHFRLERPLVYEAGIPQLPEDSTWKAGLNERLVGIPVKNMKSLLGFNSPLVSDEMTTLGDPCNDPRNLFGPKSFDDATLREIDEMFADETEIRTLTGDDELPKNFNLAEAYPQCDSIGKIRDQQMCGSCWAVAGAAAFSDRLCIASGGKFNKEMSAQYLSSCHAPNGDGCQGGAIHGTWQLLNQFGAPSGSESFDGETCYPYPDFPREGMSAPPCSSTCTDKQFSGKLATDTRKTSTNTVYRLKDIESIKREIMTRGSVVAGFFVDDNIFSYKSGVYVPQGKFCIVNRGHAVRIIGWGEEQGVPYWLVANSWSTGFGDQGFIKYAMGYNGIEVMLFASDVSAPQAEVFLA